MILSSDDVKLIQEFKENAFKCVLSEIKSDTSWTDKKNLRETFKKYGFTGPFTYLRKYYVDREEDMLNTIELLWDTID